MESLSDIVAEMRGRGEDGRMDRRLWLDYADRIEAIDSADAWRSLYTPGNAAAIREALAEARKVIKAIGGYWAREMLPIIDAALAAPARQCDVGTPAEQERRYKATGEVYHTLTLTNALAWAQTPYAEEGGAFSFIPRVRRAPGPENRAMPHDYC